VSQRQRQALFDVAGPAEELTDHRCRLSAEVPPLPEANNQQTVNHTVSGVRVRSKIVPAVVEVRTW